MIFSKNKKETVKYDNCESYKNFISSILIDKDIKEEVLGQINYFEENGYIYFEGNNLYGRSFEKSAPLYLEIRNDQNGFICNYTRWSGRSSIKITQNDLKNGNVKVEKEELGNVLYHDNNRHENTKESFRIVYDKNNNLIYKETLKENREYDSLESSLKYTDACFHNNFELVRNWYIPNGSIICYELSKNDFYGVTSLKENYSICESPVKDPFQGVHYFFDILNKELFKSFMIGEISIEEVLEKNKEYQAKKPKTKTPGGEMIIF